MLATLLRLMAACCRLMVKTSSVCHLREQSQIRKLLNPQRDKRSTEFSHVIVMQGSLLSAYVSKICMHWKTGGNCWIPVFYDIRIVKISNSMILIAFEDLSMANTDQINQSF